MSKIIRIMVHCTGEPSNAKRNKESYRHWFFDVQHWKHFGYHAIVYQDGSWEPLQPLPAAINFVGTINDSTLACGQPDTNENTIHIAYVGGVDPTTKKEVDTRTPQQRATLAALVRVYKMQYKVTEVIGHHDWPGVKKSCPCFDAIKTYKDV